MSEVVVLKQSLIGEIRNLKDEKNLIDVRKNAYKNVINYANQIKNLDKNFQLDEKLLEKYKQFKSKETKLDLNVQWGRGRVLKDLKDEYNDYVSTALEIVQERLPQESTQTDKFGTIVNATIANLIALRKS